MTVNTYEEWLSAPLAIDTAHPYPLEASTTPAARKDYLGGLAWHPAFSAYIGKERPLSVEETAALRDEWWREPYILERLNARLGRKAVMALLEWLRDGEHYVKVTIRHRKGELWLERQRRKAVRMVKHEYLPELVARHVIYGDPEAGRVAV